MLVFLELVLVILTLIVLITQVVMPLFKSEKIFPFFRKQGKLEKELDDAKQVVAEHNIEVQIEETLKSVQVDSPVVEVTPVATPPKAKRKPAVPKSTVATPVVKPKAKRKPKA